MTDYRKKSDSLLSYIQNQLSQFGAWTNVPGALKKISSSPGGYVWGVNEGGLVWVCREPCSDGNWRNIPSPPSIQDIATDSRYVYILFESNEAIPESPDIQKDDIVTVRHGNFYVGKDGLQTSPLELRVAYITGSQIGFKTLDGFWITAAPQVPGSFSATTTYADDSPLAWEVFGWNPMSPGSTSLTSAHGNVKITNEQTGEFAYGEPPTQFSITKKPKPATTQRKKKFGRMDIDGSSSWEFFDADGDTDNLEVTDSFFFVGKKACAKPCTTGNWVDVPQPGGAGVNQGTFSASGGSVYNIQFENGTYKVYRGTGTGQGGWTELPGLRNKIPLSASIDNTAIYVTPTDPGTYGTLERCTYPYESSESCKKVNTSGHLASSVSVNPSTNRVWLTTRESASNGNIFQRLDSENPEIVMDEVNKQNRDLERDVNSLGGDIRVTHSEVTSGMVRREASEIVKEATNLSGNIQGTFQESDKLRSKIRQGKKERSGYKNKMLPLQILTFTLAVVLLVYLVAGFLLPSSVTSVFAVVALSAGLGTAIYFAVRN